MRSLRQDVFDRIDQPPLFLGRLACIKEYFLVRNMLAIQPKSVA